MAPKNRGELLELINHAVGGKFEYADAILTAIEQAGCAVVPSTHPTGAMYDALGEADIGCEFHDAAWRAMLSASPYRKE